MITTIPAQMLKDSVSVFVPSGVDAWGKPTQETYTQTRVHLQEVSTFQRSTADMQAEYKATLFVDARLSRPFLDWGALQTAAEAAGYQITLRVGAAVYTVKHVDSVHNDMGGLHHYEVGCI